MTKKLIICLLGLSLVCSESSAQTGDQRISDAVQDAFDRAGDNRSELLNAQGRLPAEHRASFRFLIANMPDQDLMSLDADFLVTNVTVAHRVMQEVPWGRDVPKAAAPEDKPQLAIKVLDRKGGMRIEAEVKLIDSAGKVLAEGMSKGPQADMNHHLNLALRAPTNEWNGFYTEYVYPLIPDLLCLCEALLDRGDPEFMFSARMALDLKKSEPYATN